MNHYSDTHKRRMRGILTRDVRWGFVVPPDTCSACGTPGPVEAHHTGYEAPEEVRWLCHRCHAGVEREVARGRARQLFTDSRKA